LEGISECIQVRANGSFGAWRREYSASASTNSTRQVLTVAARIGAKRIPQMRTADQAAQRIGVDVQAGGGLVVIAV